MSHEIISLIIALTCVGIQVLIARYGVRKSAKFAARAKERLEKAQQQRKAARTILEFAELWRRDMSDDERMNLVIEWHDRLKEAKIRLEIDNE